MDENHIKYLVLPISSLKLVKGERKKGKVKTVSGVKMLMRKILEGDLADCYSNKSISSNVSINTLLKFVENQCLNIEYDDCEEYYEIPEFDAIQLLAYIAIRSIIGPQGYKSIKWSFILSRMSGSGKIVKDFPSHIKPYMTRRKRDKLINALVRYWGLKYYAKNVRTPYFSFANIDLEDKIENSKKSKTSNEGIDK